MADIKPPHHPLFLREEELRYSIELMFFVYRDFTGEADAVLAQRGLGRARHRVIYFVGRKPGVTVSEVLALLNITKQALGRVTKLSPIYGIALSLASTEISMLYYILYSV